jgi:hypothetical protein
MTLILAMGNQRQVILVSDRRLTRDGVVMPDPVENIPDESNKAAVLSYWNARLAVAYTGLAQLGSFLTSRWLPETILKSAAPDYLMGPAIERFRQRSMQDFGKISVVRASDKHLSVMFAGYCYDETPPRCYCFLVSNFEGLGDQQPPTPGQFVAQYARDKRPIEDEMYFLVAIGVPKAVGAGDYQSLRTLLCDDKPAQALIGKSVEVIRKAANSVPLIGKNCTSIVLPSNPDEQAIGSYHGTKLAYRQYFPSNINARGHGSGAYVIADPWVETGNANGRPPLTSIQKVGRNDPCPCGSGLKYKKCHGRMSKT